MTIENQQQQLVAVDRCVGTGGIFLGLETPGTVKGKIPATVEINLTVSTIADTGPSSD